MNGKKKDEKDRYDLYKHTCWVHAYYTIKKSSLQLRSVWKGPFLNIISILSFKKLQAKLLAYYLHILICISVCYRNRELLELWCGLCTQHKVCSVHLICMATVWIISLHWLIVYGICADMIFVLFHNWKLTIPINKVGYFRPDFAHNVAWGNWYLTFQWPW